MTELDDWTQGYMDGGDINSPPPSGNRSPAYRHSFAVRRAEIQGKPIPAKVSRARVRAIQEAESNV